MGNRNPNQYRRKLIKIVAGLGGTAAISASVPGSWTQPVVQAVLLPAHAATSGISNTFFAKVTGTVTSIDRPDDWLDVLVPRAYASTLPTGLGSFSICIQATNGVGQVSLYFVAFSECYEFTGTMPNVNSFSGVALSPTGEGVCISGALSSDTISGTFTATSFFPGTVAYTATIGSCSALCTPGSPVGP